MPMTSSNSNPENPTWNGTKKDISASIIQSIRKFLISESPLHLNTIEDWRDIVSDCIVSGGSSDRNVPLELIEEILNQESIKMHSFSNIAKNQNMRVKKGIFATLNGLFTMADLAFDIGNSYSKAGFITEEDCHDGRYNRLEG